MTQPPKHTDRTALLHHRVRASRAPVMFLHENVRDEIKERLNEVNRTFTRPAIITPFPEVWQEVFPEATFIPDQAELPLKRGHHDLVIHSMALHWADDPVGQLVQSRIALAPDGLFIAASFGGKTLNELRTCLAEAEVALTGGISPRIAPMAEIRDLGALLQRAGFGLPVADVATRICSYASLAELKRDLRGMGETNALEARLRAPAPKGLFELAERLYIKHFATPDNRIPATFDLIYLTGWAPDDNQQTPLRPGSATSRLADALNVDEITLPYDKPTNRD